MTLMGCDVPEALNLLVRAARWVAARTGSTRERRAATTRGRSWRERTSVTPLAGPADDQPQPSAAQRSAAQPRPCTAALPPPCPATWRKSCGLQAHPQRAAYQQAMGLPLCGVQPDARAATHASPARPRKPNGRTPAQQLCSTTGTHQAASTMRGWYVLAAVALPRSFFWPLGVARTSCSSFSTSAASAA